VKIGRGGGGENVDCGGDCMVESLRRGRKGHSVEDVFSESEGLGELKQKKKKASRQKKNASGPQYKDADKKRKLKEKEESRKSLRRGRPCNSMRD